jgi:hypothetical protein
VAKFSSGTAFCFRRRHPELPESAVFVGQEKVAAEERATKRAITGRTRPTRLDFYPATATGGGKANLTKDSRYATAVGWR